MFQNKQNPESPGHKFGISGVPQRARNYDNLPKCLLKGCPNACGSCSIQWAKSGCRQAAISQTPPGLKRQNSSRQFTGSLAAVSRTTAPDGRDRIQHTDRHDSNSPKLWEASGRQRMTASSVSETSGKEMAPPVPDGRNGTSGRQKSDNRPRRPSQHPGCGRQVGDKWVIQQSQTGIAGAKVCEMNGRNMRNDFECSAVRSPNERQLLLVEECEPPSKKPFRGASGRQ